MEFEIREERPFLTDGVTGLTACAPAENPKATNFRLRKRGSFMAVFVAIKTCIAETKRSFVSRNCSGNVRNSNPVTRNSEKLLKCRAISSIRANSANDSLSI